LPHGGVVPVGLALQVNEVQREILAFDASKVEFINQPTTYPFVCMTDESYGRYLRWGEYPERR
jgi:hypothetical protein